MKIHYKRIEHERTEDAPFIGALISAIDCHFNCDGCFNQYLKHEPTLIKDSTEIISEIKDNPFNEGVILGGLEWTDQPFEMKKLIECAIQNNLKVMLYTGYDENFFLNLFPDIYEMPIMFKFGQYEKGLSFLDNYQFDIKLASSNQKIRSNYDGTTNY